MVASGIPPLAAMLTSLLVFAGASMVASAQLLASGTPALLVILTTLFINLRFMMYSASLRAHFAHAPLRWRLLIAYLVLTAIWAPEVLVDDERLLAGVVAIAVAWRWRTTFATIIAGLLALHLFGFLR
ncbi:MAG: AzlC family ABC transporter permease [Betaproteobacteria bacterium]|nr:MAG: AzlC family ABC transporter permease [Betaproteobacteria bacterium]